MPISVLSCWAVGEEGWHSSQQRLEYRIDSLRSPLLKSASPRFKRTLGIGGPKREGFPVKRNGVFVMFLPGLEQGDVRVSFCVSRMRLENRAPCSFGLGVICPAARATGPSAASCSALPLVCAKQPKCDRRETKTNSAFDKSSHVHSFPFLPVDVERRSGLSQSRCLEHLLDAAARSLHFRSTVALSNFC